MVGCGGATQGAGGFAGCRRRAHPAGPPRPAMRLQRAFMGCLDAPGGRGGARQGCRSWRRQRPRRCARAHVHMCACGLPWAPPCLPWLHALMHSTTYRWRMCTKHAGAAAATTAAGRSRRQPPLQLPDAPAMRTCRVHVTQPGGQPERQLCGRPHGGKGTGRGGGQAAQGISSRRLSGEENQAVYMAARGPMAQNCGAENEWMGSVRDRQAGRQTFQGMGHRLEAPAGPPGRRGAAGAGWVHTCAGGAGRSPRAPAPLFLTPP